jgi:lipopolysaccharide assembly outer membrane protein LptD (OstA)
MRLLTFSVVIACQLFLLAPRSTCQDTFAAPGQLHMTISVPGSHGDRMVLTAASIERDLSITANKSVIQLKGDVQIRMITCIPSAKGDVKVCESTLALRADEVSYNEKTGEMDPRGNVHITPRQP